MARFSSADLRREIRRELDTDPDISKAAILRRLRGRGLTGGNQRLRVLVEFERQDTGSPGDLLRVQAGSVSRILVTLQEAGATRRADAGAVSDATHASITYVARYSAQVYFYGQPTERLSGSLTGEIVQEIRHYNRDLIEARVTQQILGRIVAGIGTGSESFIEGIDVELLDVDISVSAVELRGNSRRRR